MHRVALELRTERQVRRIKAGRSLAKESTAHRQQPTFATKSALLRRADPAEWPLCADIVEEVGSLTVRDGARSQARVRWFVLRQALGRATGSALPAFCGFGLWQRGGTRLEHQTDLSA